MSRQRIIVLFLIATIATGVGGWMAGRLITSPGEAAARTAAPEAAPILVPLEKRVLTTDIVARGEARFGSPRVVTMAPSSLKPEAGVITQVPIVGTELAEGDLVLAASGRPLFILEGAIPVYRDLGPGLTGEDVAQLEEALVRLGFLGGPADRVYDGLTEAAVSAWYISNGWEPFSATEQQLAEIRALEQELVSAQNDGLGASDALSSAHADKAAAVAAVAGAKDAVALAGLEISAAEAEAASSSLTAAADVADAKASLDQLLADPDSTDIRTEADAAIRDAELALAQLQIVHLNAIDAATTAELALTAAIAEADVANQAAEADVTSSQAALDLLLADPTSDPLDVLAAETDLALAISGQESVRLSGLVLVQSAQDDKAAAGREVSVAATEVTSAQTALDNAVAYRALLDDPAQLQKEIDSASKRLHDAQAAADSVTAAGKVTVQAAHDAKANAQREVTIAEAQLSAATTALSNALSQSTSTGQLPGTITTDLNAAKLRAGVQVPADELVFVTSATVRVEGLDVAVGDTASGSVMTVTDKRMAIDASLPLNEAPLVSVGMHVDIDEPELGLSATGTVSRVADRPGTDGVDGFHVYFEIEINDSPAAIVGVAVRLTIPIESSGGPVLAVPVAGLSLAGDGSSRVQIAQDGVFSYVEVEPVLAADGYVQVRAIDANLDVGDLIVIGYDQPGADIVP